MLISDFPPLVLVISLILSSGLNVVIQLGAESWSLFDRKGG